MYPLDTRSFFFFECNNKANMSELDQIKSLILYVQYWFYASFISFAPSLICITRPF